MKTKSLIVWRRLARLFGGQILFAAILVVLALITGSAVLIWAFEQGVNPNVDGPGSGFYWVGNTMITSPPWPVQTSLGKFAFYTVLVIKPGLMALITAAIASKLVQFVLRANSGKGKAKVKDHIIICGWSAKGAEIIQEIRGRDDEEHLRPIVVVAPLAQNPTTDELTTFISGDPADTATLERAGIQNARTAIMLADNSYPGIDMEEMDSKTLLSTLAVEALNPDCYTCVEVIHSYNREHFERAHADELLMSGKMTGAILAHSAVTYGLSRVLDELVSHPTGNEFYWVEVNEQLDGLQFHEALSSMKLTHDAVPLAVAENEHSDYQTNPPAERVLKKGERLLVIADKAPRLV